MSEIQAKIGSKIREAIEMAGKSNREAARMLEMSENSLYKIYNKEHVNTEILYNVSDLFGVPITFFFDENADKKMRVKVDGDKNLTISGETNFFSGTRYSNEEKNSENKSIEQEYKMILNIVKQKDIIIEEKDKVIEEKEKLIDEKERFIQYLIGNRPKE